MRHLGRRCEHCGRTRQVAHLAQAVTPPQQSIDGDLGILGSVYVGQDRLVHVGAQRPPCVEIEQPRVRHQPWGHRGQGATARRRGQRFHDAAEQRTGRRSLGHVLDHRANGPHAPAIRGHRIRTLFEPRVDESEHDQARRYRTPGWIPVIERGQLGEESQMPYALCRVGAHATSEDAVCRERCTFPISQIIGRTALRFEGLFGRKYPSFQTFSTGSGPSGGAYTLYGVWWFVVSGEW